MTYPLLFSLSEHISSQIELVKRMCKDGHIVGNHTWHHPDMSQMSTLESFQKELTDVEKIYKETTGKDMVRFYRPPQGKYSKENLKMAQDLGYKTFFWSLAYVDWYDTDQPTKAEAFDKLLKRIHPGAIVLLHSTSKTNADILDELLTKWKEMGYQIKAFNPTSLSFRLSKRHIKYHHQNKACRHSDRSDIGMFSGLRFGNEFFYNDIDHGSCRKRQKDKEGEARRFRSEKW